MASKAKKTGAHPWTDEQRAKFRATMAKKRAAAKQLRDAAATQSGWSSLPLESIPAPDRKHRPVPTRSAPSLDRLKLAAEVVQLLLSILKA